MQSRTALLSTVITAAATSTLALWSSHGLEFNGHQNAPHAELLITHVRILDVRTGAVAASRTIVVRDGAIAQILPDADAAAQRITSRDTLDAHGRLVTPAFVDVHLHSGYILGDSITPSGGMITHLSTNADSVRAYRTRVANEYLPYGVTLVRDAGSATKDLPLLLSWIKRASDFPDFLPSGAQFVSPEQGRVPPPFQTIVLDSAEAAMRVRAYAAMGIRHIKLYWRLQEPALIGALTEANKMGMTVAAHIDNEVVSIPRALALGVRHFEHAFPIALDVLTDAQKRSAWNNTLALMKGSANNTQTIPGAFIQYELQQWRLIGDNNARILEQIDRLRATHSTVTPTLHVFSQPIGVAEFSARPMSTFDDTRKWTPAQRTSAIAGYRAMQHYVAQLDSAGVHLATGSDTQMPGRGVLDELLQLNAAGIAPWRVFRIATLYASETLGKGAEYGAVEVGRRANLIVFDEDPLVNMRGVLGRKTVVKDGVVR